MIWNTRTAVLAVVLAWARVALAQPDLSGDWEGAIQAPGEALRVVLTFEPGPDQGWRGVIDIPQQGASDLPLGPVEVRGDSVRFALPGPSGDPRFAGTLSADGRTLAGTFVQGGASLTFSVQRVDAAAKSALLQARMGELSAAIDTLLTSWKVPGLAIAIVKDGQTVLARGFGQRNAEQALPVTPSTLFAIGSTTKAMTAVCLAMLVDEGLVDWEERVRTYLPSFTLKDEVLTEHLSVRDLVTHRSGLPRHDMLWYGSPLTRQELFDRLRYLEASRDLRQTFQYNNLMYMVAGHLVGQVTGGTWEEFMRQRLFTPLGMTGATLSVTASQQTDDFALPYDERDAKVVPVPFRNLDAIGPAGAVNAGASDMARWLKFNLDGGKVGDRQLVSPAGLEDIYASHMSLPGPAEQDEVALQSYGMGWIVHSYRGHYRLEHGGGIDGFTTSVSLLPRDGLGIAVMANRNGSPLPDIVARQATDLLLGLEPIDWHARRKQGATQVVGGQDVPIAGTRPAHPLADYLGEYTHPAYGKVVIGLKGDKLTLAYNTVSSPLKHFHYDTFICEESDLKGVVITFHTDASGEVARLSSPLEPAVEDIEFVHEPVVREYAVLRASAPVAVDGKLDEVAWRRAAYTDDFVLLATGARGELRTRVRMLWTDTHWYLAWTMEDPDVHAEMAERDARVFQEDSVELFVDPDGNERNYAQVIANARGTVMDQMVNKAPSAGGFESLSWTLEGLAVAVSVEGTANNSKDKDQQWVCEMAIPFASLASLAGTAGIPPKPADQWRVNLCRNEHDRRSGEGQVVNTAWSRTDKRGFHAPNRFGRVHFSSEVAE